MNPHWKLLVALTSLVVPLRLAVAQVPPPLHTPAPTFEATDRYVATTVFHWYISTHGQRSGPWAPPEGRPSWTGEPDWWQGQIKQMMSANIDVLYVHLYPGHEQERINLFKALSQLRAEGYDTPKVAPFLDPVTTWTGQPVDVATVAGKDDFVGQYIRFFDQYFSATTDDHAADYLARQDEKLILDMWVVTTATNLASLTRSDVTSRLSAAFAAEYPVFANGIVMVTGVAQPTVSFADEKVAQFEALQYYVATTHNSIQSVQLKGGYWDQNIRNPGNFLPRAGGLHYQNAWNQVNRNTTRRVYIESWNEYDEGTGIYAAQNTPYIAPANTSGNTDTWSTTGDPFEYIKTTASGAAAFNDVPAQDAIILWHNLPATLTPGETRKASVIVRNTGDASWTAAANYQLGQADADTAFVANKRVLLDDTKDEIPLYGGIFRGRAKVFEVTLTAPASLGTYTTHWRMRQQGGAAFGGELTFPIEVKNKTAATIALGNLAQMEDGTPRSVTATTSPAGLPVALTYDGSPYPPSAVGSYTVLGIIDDPTYKGSTTGTLTVTADPNLVAIAGGFETQSDSATFVSPPDKVDAATFPGWRIFNVVSASVDFGASIISNASTGTRAMRLAVNNTGGASNYALDQWAPETHTPVQQGTNYSVSFDAAWIAGATASNVLFQVQEFDSSGAYLANGLSELLSVSTSGYQNHSFVYSPSLPDTAEIGLFFGPMRGVVGATTISIDNIRMTVDPSQSPPAIAKHPLTQAATAGDGVTLSVEATGTGPFTYQWYRDGTAISGATAATLILPSAQEFQQGTYTATVTNSFGQSSSGAAALTVNAPPSLDGQLQNLSTRGLSLTGDNLLIPGFSIQGTGTKHLLIRAVGPQLGVLGVPGALMDPQMVLKRLQNGVFVDVASNDDWGTNANAADIISTSDELFAFPLSAGSADSALLLDLQPGQYTVVTSGVNDTTGVAIVELYDADSGTPTSRMTSISNRGFVDIGDKVMIPGIVISDAGSQTLLIRVVGPTLAENPFNVPGVLEDPVLTLFRGNNTVLTIDDWGTDPDMAAQVRSVGQSVFAFALTEGSADAAVVVTLEPGLYTVVASGANNGTGVALVEVYEVP